MKTREKNLLNPTPQQVKIRNRMWAEALIKNKKKTTGKMYCDGGRCCLAVAQNVAIANGVDIPKNYENYGFPHNDVVQFFGWDNENPRLFIATQFGLSSIEASDLNDEKIYSANGSLGMSHKKISQCVMNTFVHPSKKKWSFQIEACKH